MDLAVAWPLPQTRAPGQQSPLFSLVQRARVSGQPVLEHPFFSPDLSQQLVDTVDILQMGALEF